MSKYKFFSLSEFDSPDSPGSGAQMQDAFLALLDKARAISDTPYSINSGFRTPEYNARVDGKKRSAHLRGYAADIAVSNATFLPILRGLVAAGFNRFGIAQGFIHVDNDPTLPQGAIWTYKNSKLEQERKAFLEGYLAGYKAGKNERI